MMGRVGATLAHGGGSDGWAVRESAINQKVAGSIPGQLNVVPLGKALHPTCLGGNIPVPSVSHSG